MDYHVDEVSFAGPFRLALEHTKREFLDAGASVAGANRRAEERYRNLEDLLTFSRKLQDFIDTGGFAELPGLRNKLSRIDHCHHLTVGVWRGIFLVAPDRSAAVALIFSSAPHNYMLRLDELRDSYLREDRIVPSGDRKERPGS